MVGRSLIRWQEIPRRNGLPVSPKGDTIILEEKRDLSLRLNVRSRERCRKLWQAWESGGNYELHREIRIKR